jgi:hypothetical protein
MNITWRHRFSAPTGERAQHPGRAQVVGVHERLDELGLRRVRGQPGGGIGEDDIDPAVALPHLVGERGRRVTVADVESVSVDVRDRGPDPRHGIAEAVGAAASEVNDVGRCQALR